MYQVVVVAVLTLTRIVKSVVTGQAPVTREWKNIEGKKKDKPKSCTRMPGISQLKQVMHPPKNIKMSSSYEPSTAVCSF